MTDSERPSSDDAKPPKNWLQGILDFLKNRVPWYKSQSTDQSPPDNSGNGTSPGKVPESQPLAEPPAQMAVGADSSLSTIAPTETSSASQDQKTPPTPARSQQAPMARIPWKIGGVLVIYYLPTFLLVVVSFFFFKPASTQTNQKIDQQQIEQIKKEVTETVQDEPAKSKTQPGPTITPEQISQIKKAIQEEIGKLQELEKMALAQQKVANDNSIVAQGYIEGEIKSQSEEAAENKVGELKENLKGDLFGQIAFPVIVAIASIFVAFAVKDALTEIIKEAKIKELEEKIHSNIAAISSQLESDFKTYKNKEEADLKTYREETKSELHGAIKSELDEDIRNIYFSLTWIAYELASLTNELLTPQTKDPLKIKETINSYKSRTMNLLQKLKELNIEPQKLALLREYERVSLAELARKTTSTQRYSEDFLTISVQEPASDVLSSKQIIIPEDTIQVKITRLKLLVKELESAGFQMSNISQMIADYDNDIKRRDKVSKAADKDRADESNNNWL